MNTAVRWRLAHINMVMNVFQIMVRKSIVCIYNIFLSLYILYVYLIVCPVKHSQCPWAPFPLLIQEYITVRQQLWAQLCLLRMKYSHLSPSFSPFLHVSLSSFYPGCFCFLSLYMILNLTNNWIVSDISDFLTLLLL